jgi:excisionase family DNA binding protein
MEEYMTVFEAAAVLKAKPRTVRGWIREGKLRAYKVGGMRLWRVRRADLRAFLRPGRESQEKRA